MNAKMNKKKEMDYVAYLTVRVSGGYVTVKLVRCGVGLRAVVGVVGRVPEVPRFGPWPEWVVVLKSVLSALGIVTVEGNTFPIRGILAELGFWFDKRSKVYKRGAPLDTAVSDAEEPTDFYAELGF